MCQSQFSGIFKLKGFKLQLFNSFLPVNALAPLQMLSRTSSHKQEILQLLQPCTSSFHVWTLMTQLDVDV